MNISNQGQNFFSERKTSWPNIRIIRPDSLVFREIFFQRKRVNENLKNYDSVSKFKFFETKSEIFSFSLFISTASKIISLNHDYKTTFILSFREIKSFSNLFRVQLDRRCFFLTYVCQCSIEMKYNLQLSFLFQCKVCYRVLGIHNSEK